MPPDIYALTGRIESAGGRAWLVGGAVRDNLLRRPHHDFDLATDLHPPAMAALFPEARIDDHFGSCELPRIDDGVDGGVTMTALRQESDYDSRRRPRVVEFLGGEQDTSEEQTCAQVARDAQRRDFTVNAIYVDLQRQVVLDPVDGLVDLHARVLKVIGHGAERLAEDPLRLLRLHRFAATLGFSIDPDTRATARSLAASVSALSGARIFAELTKTFMAPHRGRALRDLVDEGIAEVVLPEVVAMEGVEQPPQYHPEGDVLTHVCMVLQAIDPVDDVQAWSAVLHDVGKPGTFRRAEDRIRFDGHDQLSAQLAESVLRRMHASTAFRELVVDVCRQHIRFAAIPEMRPATWQRWMREPNFADHLAFHRADCTASHGQLGIFKLATERFESLPPLPDAPLVTGRDVLDRGIGPGPAVGSLLREVENRMAESDVSTRDQALLVLDEVVAAFTKG